MTIPLKDLFTRVAVAEWQDIKPIAPIILGFLVAVTVALGIFHGIGWYLVLFPLGGLLGAVVLDIDKILGPYLGTEANFFHLFKIYPLVFLLAIFVITANATVFGKGMVLSMLVHGLLSFTNKQQQIIAGILLGIAVILLLI